MSYLQFPWRFINFIALFISFIVGYGIYSISHEKKLFSYTVSGVIIILVIYTSLKLFSPQNYVNYKDYYYTNSNYISYKVSKISDEYMPKDFIKPKNETEIVKNKLTIESGTGKIESVVEKTQQIKANLNISKSATILIHTAYFPGWKVYSNDKEIFHFDSHRGFLVFLPVGEHKLTVKFQETFVEQIGNVISFVGISLLIVGIMYSIRRKIW
jgi:hypothetical protein